ncbi:MAG: substrate-binding domain-containing protein [Phycisphaeraceae bacterium]
MTLISPDSPRQFGQRRAGQSVDTAGGRRRRVVIAVPTSYAFGQQIVRGAGAFVQEEGLEWDLLFQPGLRPSRIGILPDLDAAIIHSHPFTRNIIARHVQGPIVCVEQDPVDDWPVVRTNNRAIGELAFEHLAEQGFERFAFWGNPGRSYADDREKGLARRVEQAGLEFHPMPGSPLIRAADAPPADLHDWLRALPTPAAVLAQNDETAARIIWACHGLKVSLPEEVAILGVDNDELLCKLMSPPLSSIDHGCWQVGYEAAKTLAELLAGRSPRQKVQLVQPVCVVSRQSTDTLAIDHPDVAQALRLIRRRATEGLSASEVVRHSTMPRRTLEIAFRHHVGRTLQQEITRVRVGRARHLLATSRLSITEVALRSGFTSASYFARVFTRQAGTPPTRYRREHRTQTR